MDKERLRKDAAEKGEICDSKRVYEKKWRKATPIPMGNQSKRQPMTGHRNVVKLMV